MLQNTPASPETRLAVLEQIAVSHEKRISDIEDFHRDVVDRLDQKIQLDAANQVVMERTMARAVTTLDALTTSLQTVAANAEEAKRISLTHQTIGSTIIKVAGAIALVISGIWAVVKLFIPSVTP